MVKACMNRAHKIFMEQTNDFHWKRTMASYSRKLAQNHVAAPLRREQEKVLSRRTRKHFEQPAAPASLQRLDS